MGQTNRDGARAWQSDIRGGTNYVGEIHIHNSSSATTATSNGHKGQSWITPHNIPASQTAYFVGRDPELEQLHELLQQNKVVAITDATGEGGVGKTELAVQYCLRHQEQYSGGICWLSPKNLDIGTQIVEFAIVQFLEVPIPDGISLINQVSFCWRRWLPGQTLLVIDNVTATDYESGKKLGIAWKRVQ